MVKKEIDKKIYIKKFNILYSDHKLKSYYLLIRVGNKYKLHNSFLNKSRSYIPTCIDTVDNSVLEERNLRSLP